MYFSIQINHRTGSYTSLETLDCLCPYASCHIKIRGIFKSFLKIEALSNFDQAAVGSYLMITNPNIWLLGS